jgi:hypothetical protein
MSKVLADDAGEAGAEGRPLDAEVSWREELATWWAQAWPTGLSIFFRNSAPLTDIIVLGHLGTRELAAAGVANLFMVMTAGWVWKSLGGAINTLGSQALGAGNPRLAGECATGGEGEGPGLKAAGRGQPPATQPRDVSAPRCMHVTPEGGGSPFGGERSTPAPLEHSACTLVPLQRGCITRSAALASTVPHGTRSRAVPRRATPQCVPHDASNAECNPVLPAHPAQGRG